MGHIKDALAQKKLTLYHIAFTSVMDSCVDMHHLINKNKGVQDPNISIFRKILLSIQNLFEKIKSLEILSSFKNPLTNTLTTQDSVKPSTTLPPAPNRTNPMKSSPSK